MAAIVGVGGRVGSVPGTSCSLVVGLGVGGIPPVKVQQASKTQLLLAKHIDIRMIRTSSYVRRTVKPDAHYCTSNVHRSHEGTCCG